MTAKIIQHAEGSHVVAGNMTLDTAAVLLSDGVVALEMDEAVFDLAEVEDVDSSGLAVLFGWQRAAQAQGKSLKILHPPRNLISLAEVYGVADLLPLS